MKRILLLLIVLIVSTGFAQEAEKTGGVWKNELVGNLNFSQITFDNWTKGGENSWAWQLDILGKATRDMEKFVWSNSGKLSFGKTQIGDAESRKSADEIRLESVLSYKMKVHINPFVAVTAVTQFARGYNYTDGGKVEISKFMDPGYFTQSIGFGYNYQDQVKTRLGAALKETITSDHPVPYADDPATSEIEKTKVEYGVESSTELNFVLSENILYNSKLDMFSNVKRFDEIDVNWDNIFSAKVSDYIKVNFNIVLFYDKDLSTKRQLKQSLSVGLSYTFI